MRQFASLVNNNCSQSLKLMDYYHLKSEDDRVYVRTPRNKYTHKFRTQILAMSTATGWSESKCVNYVQRKLKEKEQIAIQVATIFKFDNRLTHK